MGPQCNFCFSGTVYDCLEEFWELLYESNDSWQQRIYKRKQTLNVLSRHISFAAVVFGWLLGWFHNIRVSEFQVILLLTKTWKDSSGLVVNLKRVICLQSKVNQRRLNKNTILHIKPYSYMNCITFNNSVY